MLHQKYSNGLWIGLTTHVKPKCLSIFHYVPFAFVLSIFVSAMLLPFSPLFLVLLLTVYSLLVISLTILALLKHKNEVLLLMPFMLFSIHFAYGIGTIVGLIKGFKWRKGYKYEIQYLN